MTHEHEVQKFYDSALHAYERIMGNYWHHGDPDANAVGLPRDRSCEVLQERLVSLSGLPKGGRALDFGSGIGGPTIHMAEFSGASFVGVTNNDRLTQVARRKARERGVSDQVTFQTIDDLGYQHLPFPDASFDAVTFYESVCHLTDKAAFFREVARVLKPGGRLAALDWLQRPFGEHQTEEQIMRFMRPVNEIILLPWHGTVEGYRQMMEAAGLKVFIARDLYPGVKCWSPAMDTQTPDWEGYDGPEGVQFRKGEVALDAARRAGVFTVGIWVAGKPA